jgi:FtsP/CotA-like multicopper oxidase with cupredoxin domain
MVNEAATLWYHDHALGKTRVNVAAGPAGFFNISDPPNEPAGLPSGKYEINVVFQDRDFNAPQPGSNLATINFPNGLNWAQVAPVAFQTPLTPGGNPTVHPQWVPEYFGTFPIVNGMAWPVLNVEPRKYRFHFLDGSNARCWALQRSDMLPMTIIGDDQGYLSGPQSVAKLTMCPGERYDVIIDFTGQLVGAKIYLTNVAPAPFPRGVIPTKFDVGKPMQFKVVALTAPDTSVVPATLVPVTPLSQVGAPIREMVLNEVLDAVTLFPLRVQIDGKSFEAPITETPTKGTTEVWKFINTTGDAHPIHLHLVKYQIVSRQTFDAAKYSAATGFAVPGNTVFTKLPIAPYLKGAPRPPALWEAGWKDTGISYPGEVLTIIANWDGKWNTLTPEFCTTTQDPVTLLYTQTCAQGDGLPGVPTATLPPTPPAFLPVTSGPYVWHCHIVDHEDNEMMRPVVVQ